MIRTISSMRRELAWAHKSLDRGFARFALDTAAFRALRLFPRLPITRSEGRLATRDGVRFVYRRNRGDIQSIREVFIDGCYRLPVSLPRTLVDLGGNIGLTTLWLTHQYPSIATAILVEPFPPNAELAKRNMAINSLNVKVITAAIAPQSGTAFFTPSSSSNLGRLTRGYRDGLTVNTVTMEEILKQLGSSIDVLKMDIEGGEQELLTAGDLSWLNAVGCIVAEFHPKVVDYELLTRTIMDHGFDYYRSGSLWTNSMDIFMKHTDR